MTIEDLARSIAAGFRALKNEARQQRQGITQLQEAVVEYSRSVEQRDARHAEDISRLQEEVRELQRQDAE
jgi:DNA-directed RNA polymerase subunit F